MASSIIPIAVLRTLAPNGLVAFRPSKVSSTTLRIIRQRSTLSPIRSKPHVPIDKAVHLNRNAQVVLHSGPGKPVDSRHDILEACGQFVHVGRFGRENLSISIHIPQLPITTRGKLFSYAAFFDSADHLVVKAGRYNVVKFKASELLNGPKIASHLHGTAVISLSPGFIAGIPVKHFKAALPAAPIPAIAAPVNPCTIPKSTGWAKVLGQPLHISGVWPRPPQELIDECQAHAYKLSGGANTAWWKPQPKSKTSATDLLAQALGWALPWGPVDKCM